MTTRYYRVPLGGSMKEDVTEAGSSSVAWVELAVVYDADGNSKMALVQALEALRQFVAEETWPPA
ncbi:MAG: hypothetical protein BroJett013_07260 [Alphaproteobacteria bacterium]|nr:MAG: hypothetical protein BroJett013_07260 [Alphaproteobacteria bacterium]